MLSSEAALRLDTVILPADDARLRRRALAASPDYGEDAYHDAVIEYLRRPGIREPLGWITVNTRFQIQHHYRHEMRERANTAMYVAGISCPQLINIAKGRAIRLEKVRKGICQKGLHELTPENRVKVGSGQGGPTTCKACKKAWRKAYRQRTKPWRKQPKSNSLTS